MDRKPKFNRTKFYEYEYWDLGCFFVSIWVFGLEFQINKWRKFKEPK